MTKKKVKDFQISFLFIILIIFFFEVKGIIFLLLVLFIYFDSSKRIKEEEQKEIVSSKQYFYLFNMFKLNKSEEEILKVCKNEFKWEDETSYSIINIIKHELKRIQS